MIRISCVLIGSGSLPVECAGILEEAGHEVLAILTADEHLAAWARGRELPVHDPREPGLAGRLNEMAPDYLFSAVNLDVTPAEILATARKAAFNFHDGPLPEYAGINTPAWAILNGVSDYGATWHLMTSAVDGGDILQQKRFDVSADATSLSLNARCYQHAIESFRDLVAQVTADALQPTPQGE